MAIQTKPSVEAGSAIKDTISVKSGKKEENRVSKAKNTDQTLAPAGKKEKAAEKTETTSVNKYLKMINMLENRLNNNSMQRAEIENILQNLADKIDELKPSLQEKIWQATEYQDLQITEDEDFVEKLMSTLDEPEAREKMFAFLRSQNFLEAINGESKPLVYTRESLAQKASTQKLEDKQEKAPPETSASSTAENEQGIEEETNEMS